MRRSEERILTTHAGSLARNPELSALLIRQEHGKPVDPAELDAAIRARTRHVVASQLESGIDIGGDGEQARAGYSTYPALRMSGFGGSSTRNDLLDFQKFPLYAEAYREAFRTNPEERSRIVNAPQAVAEVRYDPACAGARAECEAFEDALARQEESFAETFVTAASPGCVLTIMQNAHYASDRDYLFALARELKTEYAFIVGRGHLLQIDAPDLAMERYLYFRDVSDAAFLASVEDHIEALNMALADVPRERVRLHVCWGTWDGPHADDTPLAPPAAAPLRSQGGRAQHPLRQPRPPARIRDAAPAPPAPLDGPDPGRDRQHDQASGASGGGGRAHPARGRRGGGSRTRDRGRRLRLRRLHRQRDDDRGHLLGEVPRAARRRRPRQQPAVGLARGLPPVRAAGARP